MVREIVVPGLEGAADVTLGAWLRRVGDRVEAGDAVAEALTDKVNAEIESPYSGVVEELLVEVGGAIQPGQPIARIRISPSPPRGEE
jgi:pyruvate/2-oxoglutarate dehydrogenase complex dihydrolipoamide acyltransferase (E2) component